MGGKVDPSRRRYGPLKDKSMRNALSHRMGREFPRLGGPRILGLCADLVMEVVSEHVKPLENLCHGQVLWMGVSIDDPPSRGKRIANTDLVPLVLDLCVDDDIEEIVKKELKGQRILRKSLRLCRQAYEQGALLANTDLAALLGVSDSYVASLLCEHERAAQKVVPRRATLHDMGSGLTHKRIIVKKRFVEGKAPDQVARETYHSLEAVDRYLGQYDRVRHCRLQNMGEEETAFTLGISVSLVREYLEIDLELGGDS